MGTLISFMLFNRHEFSRNILFPLYLSSSSICTIRNLPLQSRRARIRRDMGTRLFSTRLSKLCPVSRDQPDVVFHCSVHSAIVFHIPAAFSTNWLSVDLADSSLAR